MRSRTIIMLAFSLFRATPDPRVLHRHTRQAIRVPLAFTLIFALAPATGHAAADVCSATLAGTTFTIPAMRFADQFYSLILEITAVSGDRVEMEVVDAAAMPTPTCVITAALFSDASSDTALTLTIPVLLVGSDSYRLILGYDPIATASGSTQPSLRAAQKVRWVVKEVYRNAGVWIGNSSCTHTLTFSEPLPPPLGGSATSIITEKTETTAMFACAAPEPLGLLHCIGLDDNGVSKGVWNVVSGALRYDFHELAMSPGCFSNAVGNVYSWVRQGTLELRHNGDTIGVAVVPNGDDDAIGVGVSFDMDVTGQCAGVPAPINTRVPVERPALWLGFTPDFAFASSGQSFYGEGTVFDRGQSKLTCEWEFEFHDVYPP